MADAPQLVVRVAANLADLKAALAEGTSDIVTTSTALGRMSNAFDGSRTIQQAGAVALAIQNMGGVTNLTAAEQAKANTILDAAIEKYQAMGKEVPAGMQALADATSTTQGFSLSMLNSIPIVGQFIAALSVERVIAFAEGALEAAGRLQDLSLATGISTDGLQRLQYVGAEFGLDLDQLARGVEQLSAKLANGDANATKAVEMLGLSVSNLLAMSPQDVLLTIAEAAGRIEDPMTKSGIATDLFGGRLAKVLVPVLQDLRDKINAVPDLALVSQENIQKAKDFDTDVAHLGQTIKALTVDTITWLSAGAKMMAMVQGFYTPPSAPRPSQPNPIIAPAPSHGTGSDDQGGGSDQKLTNAQLWANMLDALKQKQEALKNVNVDELASEAALGVSAKDLADHYGITEQGVTQLIDAHKKFQAALDDVNTAGSTWKVTLDTIDGTIVDWAEHLLQAGVSQKELATYYGLSDAQAKALSLDIADQKRQLDLTNASILETTKLWDEYDAAATSRSGTSMDAQIAAVDKWAEDLEAKMQKAGTDTAAFYDALAAVWTQKLNALSVDTKALQDAATNDSQRGLQQIADKAYATYQEALKHVGEWSDGTIQKFQQTYEAAQKAADSWGMDNAAWLDSLVAKQNALTSAVAATVNAVTTLNGNAMSAFAGYGESLTQAALTPGSLLGFSTGTMVPSTQPMFDMRIPGRAVGGPVSMGSPYMVGEGGPELFVPDMPGTIMPNGGGGITLHQTIQITQPLGTPQQIARVVGQASIASLKSQGVRLPSTV